jgi:hypothetical protein
LYRAIPLMDSHYCSQTPTRVSLFVPRYSIDGFPLLLANAHESLAGLDHLEKPLDVAVRLGFLEDFRVQVSGFRHAWTEKPLDVAVRLGFPEDYGLGFRV